jgi:hypothetical protein
MEQHSNAFQKRTMRIILGALILTAVLILWSLIQNAFQSPSDSDLDVPNTNQALMNSPGILTGWKPLGTEGGGLSDLLIPKPIPSKSHLRPWK